jgi:WD40 repeat protein
MLWPIFSAAEQPGEIDHAVKKIALMPKYLVSPFWGCGQVDDGLRIEAYVKAARPRGKVPQPQLVITAWHWRGGMLLQGDDIILDSHVVHPIGLPDDRYVHSDDKEDTKANTTARSYSLLWKNRKGDIVKRCASDVDIGLSCPSTHSRFIGVFGDGGRIGKTRMWKYRVGIVDAREGHLDWIFEPQTLGSNSALHIVPSDDGKRIVFGPYRHDDEQDDIAVLDVATRKLVWAIRVPGKSLSIHSSHFAADGASLLVGTRYGEVLKFDIKSGKLLGSWIASADEEPVISLAETADGKYVAAGIGGPAGEVYVRSNETGKIRRLVQGDKPILLVAFSPDSTALASVSSELISVWPRRSWDDSE